MIKANRIGFMETDEDYPITPRKLTKYLWSGPKSENKLQPDPTRTVCLNCPAYPESCEQSDYELVRLKLLERAGHLHCLLAYGRLHRLTTTEIGEAGAMTLARGLSVTAYKNYVQQIKERNCLAVK